MTKRNSYNKALSYAHRLLNYRPRSKKELKGRLQQRGYDTTIINKVITLFEQQGLIDDKSFAKLWDDTLGQLREDVDEYGVAKGLAKKRARLYAGIEKLKAKKRLFDYLRRRGFSFDIIYKVMDEIK